MKKRVGLFILGGIVLLVAILAAYSVKGQTFTRNSPIPVLTVTATDASAAETSSGSPANTGTFTVARTGSTTSLVYVPFTITGTATSGVDFGTSVAGSVVIPAGTSSTTLTVTPYYDNVTEGDETVIFTISPTPPGYTIGSSGGSATVTIADYYPGPAGWGIPGGSCGGIGGVSCSSGYRCVYSGGSLEPTYPDEAGTCRSSSTSNSGCTEIADLPISANQKSAVASFAVPSQCIANSCDFVLVSKTDSATKAIGLVRYVQLSGDFAGRWVTSGGSGTNGDGQREILGSWPVSKGSSPAISLIDDTSAETGSDNLNLVYGNSPGISAFLSPYAYNGRSQGDFKVLLC